MKVSLGSLMRQGLERQRGGNLEESVRFVLVEFAGRVERGYPIVPPPVFVSPAAMPATELEVSLDPATEATLGAQAEVYGTSADRLAGHAILASLAAYEALESSLATS
jgi:hypothetical protein